METRTYRLFDDELVVTVKYDEDTAMRIVNKIVDWCRENSVFDAECFMDDEPIINAPNLIASIVSKDLNMKAEEYGDGIL